MISVHFWGAAGEVTGSMHELSVNGRRVLLDCGMYQGRRQQAEQQNRQFPFPAASVDAVVLSHAHIDHSGNLPLLVKQGFNQAIYATSATVDLCDAMLRDTANIQVSDAKFVNKRQHQRKLGEPDVAPLYDLADAAKTMPLFHRINYHEPYEVVPSLQAEAYDAGHMLGSSATVLTQIDGDKTIRLAFSGDVGRPGLPIVRDPESLPPVDYLIMESTYGDRLHQQESEVKNKLRDIVKRTVERGGRVIVPAFAVGRVQQ
uniref:MBL fold metallo-hydrolase n=1 Tax=Nevskia soli TaxID=418856 RepID=UPI001C5CA26D